MGVPFTSTRWQIPEEGRVFRPLPNIFPRITVPAALVPTLCVGIPP